MKLASRAGAALGAFCSRRAAHWAVLAPGSTSRLITFLAGLLTAGPALGRSACCKRHHSFHINSAGYKWFNTHPTSIKLP